jgi:predicted DsbA family dithiol-disulfide isomerase
MRGVTAAAVADLSLLAAGCDGSERSGETGTVDLLAPIVIESPLPGDSVTSPIRVTGTANVFEATVSFEIRDAADKVVMRGFTTATSGTGTRGTFDTELAAANQGKLWPYVAALYANQGDENSGWVTDDLLERLANENGLDWGRLQTDAASSEVTKQIDATAADAARKQVPGTPTFFVQIGNGQPYVVQPSSLSIDAFRPILDDALDQ